MVQSSQTSLSVTFPVGRPQAHLSKSLLLVCNTEHYSQPEAINDTYSSAKSGIKPTADIWSIHALYSRLPINGFPLRMKIQFQFNSIFKKIHLVKKKQLHTIKHKQIHKSKWKAAAEE